MSDREILCPVGVQTASRVDQKDAPAAGEPEELPQYGQVAWPVIRLDSQECLDVIDVDSRPILFIASVFDKDGEVADGRQRGLNRVIGSG